MKFEIRGEKKEEVVEVWLGRSSGSDAVYLYASKNGKADYCLLRINEDGVFFVEGIDPGLGFKLTQGKELRIA
jgi:hypothetical protein